MAATPFRTTASHLEMPAEFVQHTFLRLLPPGGGPDYYPGIQGLRPFILANPPHAAHRPASSIAHPGSE